MACSLSRDEIAPFCRGQFADSRRFDRLTRIWSFGHAGRHSCRNRKRATIMASAPDDFFERYSEIEFFDVLIYDLCGIMRGKRIDRMQLRKLYREGFRFPSSVILLDVTGTCSDPLGRGFGDGDPDVPTLPVAGTLVPVPWTSKPLGQVLVGLYEEDKITPHHDDPRAVLERVINRLGELGLKPVVACELEFYLVAPVRGPENQPLAPTMPKSGRPSSGTQVYSIYEIDEFAGVLCDITEACRIQGIPAGPVSAEYAPGQFEINLHHVDDPVVACDHAALLQRVVRGVARKHGLEATFMAKPYPEGTGSGLHIHGSLLDKSGQNVFNDGSVAGSDVLRYAIGGLLETMMEGMAVFAPNLNSYRRFVSDSFVPLCAAWSYNNRSTAVRVPGGDGRSRRFEHRIAGADANPYLVLAAVLAGIHHGIVNKVLVPNPVKGNAGGTMDPAMPRTWQHALDQARNAWVLNGYFGDTYWSRYLQCKQNELDRFNNMVSPFEYDWYLLSG